MKFLLVALNAKYIHSNPGVYSLKAYAEYVRSGQQTVQGGSYPNGYDLPCWHVEIGEYTINNQMDHILQDIYRRQPDAVGFSCYIWNIKEILELVRDLAKVLPGTDIWLGGPEVSYDAPELLKREPAVTGIMKGEGEETFCRLLACYDRMGNTINKLLEESENVAGETFWEELSAVSGLTYCRGQNCKVIIDQPVLPVMDMNRLPFLYQDMAGFENRIVYYESSRGCPFSCSYCLSSIVKSVRFRDLELVKQELDFFTARKVPQVKFIDRTFNCKKSHAMAIWQHILERDNGVTNFHFEIAADLLDEEELALIRQMRPGLIQLEIGVQSTNPRTIREIRRKMDLPRLKTTVAAINAGHNVHQHLDLIAGLPYEDYESFCRSFNHVYAMQPEQLQLGFLKVLKGSYMAEMAAEYELQYRAKPPYEVLSTRWLSYGDVLRLKGVEQMVEVYYNSRQFTATLKVMEAEFSDAFAIFAALAEYYDRKGLAGLNHSRLARYEILHQFLQEYFVENVEHETQKHEEQKYETQKYEEQKDETQKQEEQRDETQKHEVQKHEEQKHETQKYETQEHRLQARIKRYEDALVYDLYLRENAKSRPSFARDQGPEKERIRCMVGELRSLGTQIHAEVFWSDQLILFDYRTKDPLTGNALVIKGKSPLLTPGEK